MSFKFNEENLERIKEARKHYPSALSAVMDACYIGQEQNGFISAEVMSEIAKTLGIEKTDVFGVVTFYTMFHDKPMGKHHIQVCTNISCMLKGGYELWDAAREKLGINHMERTEDGKFSLEEVECMGSCGTAPMIAVNEDYYENLTKEKLLEILDSLT
jgi:NADH-quinone oxidoreductase E subunit